MLSGKAMFVFKKTNQYENVFVKTLQPEDKDLDFKNGILKSDDQVAQFRACGVCLLDVEATCQDFVSEEQCAKLTYGGRQYHAVCANLWVNCVDSMLPALRLPELLWGLEKKNINEVYCLFLLWVLSTDMIFFSWISK